MTPSSHRLRVADARRVRHPVFPTIEKHYFTVKAKELPPGIRADANAREPVGTNRQVYRDVRDSLLGQTSVPGTFDLMNKGITILATEVRKVSDDVYDIVIDEGQGIVDGGHTYRIITENQSSPDLPDEQFVEVQVRTGIDDRLVTDIARGLNTGIQVKLHSLSNLDGAYNWLKDEIAHESYATMISWREGDDGEYDVRDLICILETFNIFDYPNDRSAHPVAAYEKWSIPTQKFAKDFEENESQLKESKYHRLRPVLRGGLILMDTIRHDFRTMHNDGGGSAGHLRIVEEARSERTFSFPFANLPASKYRLTKGAMYPILAAFRNLVELERKNGQVRWQGGLERVLTQWKLIGPELVAETVSATKEIGRLPDQIGKSRSHWVNLHKTLALRLLQQAK